MAFFLYKGLKKPLVIFGLKDKYIYMAMGTIGGGFLLLVLLSTLIGFLGVLIGAGLMGISLWGIFRIQDTKGLYNKTKNQGELHIMPKRFSNSKLLSHKKHEEQD